MKLLLNEAVSVTDFGAIGDAVLVDKTYVVNGRHVVSKEWKGTNNKNAFVDAFASGRKIYIPKGNYYISGDMFITNLNNIAFEGEGKFETKIIHGRFRIKDSNNILFNNIGFYGIGNKLAPDKPITTDSTKQNDVNFTWWLSYPNLGYSTYAIMTDVPTVEETTYKIQVVDCHFEMREGGMSSARNADGSGVLVRDIKMKSCSTDHLWWHGMGMAYAKNAVAENCYFKNHWIGMAVDFSSGSEGCIMSKCDVYKTSCFFKAESFDANIALNKSCKIVNNNYTSFDRVENNLKQYCFKTAGEHTLIANNKITLNDNYRVPFALYGENTLITKNKIYVNNDATTALISQYGNISVNPSMKLIDNDIYLANDLTYLVEFPGHITLPGLTATFDIVSNKFIGSKYVNNVLYNGQDNLNIDVIKIERNTIKTKRLLWINKRISSCKSVIILENSLDIAGFGAIIDIKNSVIGEINYNNNSSRYNTGFTANNSNKVSFLNLVNSTVEKLSVNKNQIPLNSEFLNLETNSKIDRCFITCNEILIEGYAFTYDFIKIDTAATYRIGVFKGNYVLGDNLKNQGNSTEVIKKIDFRTWFYEENNKYIGTFTIINAKQL
ncbi:MAG: hypothetical protein ACQEXK_06175 [Bacillota bacterium]